MADEVKEVAAEVEQGVAVPVPEVATADEWIRMARMRYVVRVPSLPPNKGVLCKHPDWSKLLADEVISYEELASINKSSAVYQNLDVARKILPHIVVEPVIVNGGARKLPKGAISADNVPESDVVALFLWGLGLSAQRGVEKEG